MTEQLKPCPFCGRDPEYFLDTEWQDKHVIECGWCGCQRRYEYDKEGVIDAWNSRPSPWVPVSERLPEDGQTCDIFLRDGCREIDCIFGVENDDKMAGWDSDCGMRDFTVSQVTHWMPLPPAPETKGE